MVKGHFHLFIALGITPRRIQVVNATLSKVKMQLLYNLALRRGPQGVGGLTTSLSAGNQYFWPKKGGFPIDNPAKSRKSQDLASGGSAGPFLL